MTAENHDEFTEAKEARWILLERIKHPKQLAVARISGVDPSTLSDFVHYRAGLRWRELRKVIEAAGLKLVPSDRRCVSEEQYLQLLRSEARLKSLVVDRAPHLLFEDDPE